MLLKKLFKFLLKHRQFYKLKKSIVMWKHEVLFNLDINDLEKGENILKLEDIVKLNEKLKTPPSAIGFSYKLDQEEEAIVKTLKYKLRKSVITNEDLPQFLDNNFLADKEYLGTKKLILIVEFKVIEKVSTSHIENISFKFKVSINFEVEKSCGVCLEDYE